ncbi:hotdog family protein [Geobacillus zalihae]|uniref:acyl dehydratase n=1 Tax=Geobacillus zalihae TaxID=213419 RepID=UPI0016805863|nr:acyl dehydratase [Geobacillus zalihae]QNU25927.1 acyl dehydratase [Geobacillus zalihae]
MKWDIQRYWEDVSIGDVIPAIEYPLSVYRLIMAAGANRDFNSIHHNSEFAKETGAPDMYANNIFLQGMWERTVREYIGLAGAIKSVKGFRMKIFNIVGDTVVTKGVVKNKWREAENHLVELEIWSENSQGISVGPGSVIVVLPSRESLKL